MLLGYVQERNAAVDRFEMCTITQRSCQMSEDKDCTIRTIETPTTQVITVHENSSLTICDVIVNDAVRPKENVTIHVFQVVSG